MAIGVHGHESGVLQESRIYAPARSGIAWRHPVDQIGFKPRIRLGRGQPIDLRGRLAGIDGAAHHDHAARSEEHTSELPSLMRMSYAVFCLTKNRQHGSKMNRHTTDHS